MSRLNKKIPDLPDVPVQEMTPLVKELIDICTMQNEQLRLKNEIIQSLKDEIAILKGEKAKPKIKPSTLEKDSKDDDKELVSWIQPMESTVEGEYFQPFLFFKIFFYNHPNPNTDADKKKRPGSKKRRKTRHLVIHNTVNVKPDNLPEGSKLKDYQDFYVQDILIQPFNTRYRLERWETPSGEYVVGIMPEGVAQGHYGIQLIRFILYQYYHAHVTQPLIIEELLEFGIDISSGKVNSIITENKDDFHSEKEAILAAGLEVSSSVHVDDTGARHKGRNGYCTHIGNEWFAWFSSTESKSRINFLTLIRGKRTDYVLNKESFDYMKANKLPKYARHPLRDFEGQIFPDDKQWQSFLNALGIEKKKHVQIATEAALIGSILENGFNRDLVIISDDAGQFNVFLHSLCWIHAERTINRLVGFTDEQRLALKSIRDQFWTLYADLKAYRENPCPKKKEELEKRFDQLFTTQTCFVSLNLALKRIYANKSELLLVLERPDLCLHNNPSENDIREYVTVRKISGGTRSDKGRKCRDTFTSLKKTCRKLRISFWEYLHDRLSGRNTIPMISDIIRQKARAPN